MLFQIAGFYLSLTGNMNFGLIDNVLSYGCWCQIRSPSGQVQGNLEFFEHVLNFDRKGTTSWCIRPALQVMAAVSVLQCNGQRRCRMRPEQRFSFSPYGPSDYANWVWQSQPGSLCKEHLQVWWVSWIRDWQSIRVFGNWLLATQRIRWVKLRTDL